MWPKLLNISNEKCRGSLRRLELEAYSNVISVFRAQGYLNDKKQKILEELRNIFQIDNDRHRAEIRRANSDEWLCTISEMLYGKGIENDWLKEGRRALPLLPRSCPLTALSHIAAQVSKQALIENKKMLKEQSEAKEATSPTAAASTTIELNNIEIRTEDALPNQLVKDDTSKLSEEIIKNEDKVISHKGMTDEEIAAVKYSQLRELLKINSLRPPTTSNHLIDKYSRSFNKSKKIKKKKDILKKHEKLDKIQKRLNMNNINLSESTKAISIEIKQKSTRKVRRKRFTRKPKVSSTSEKKNSQTNESVKSSVAKSEIISELKSIDNANNNPTKTTPTVQTCILNLDPSPIAEQQTSILAQSQPQSVQTQSNYSHSIIPTHFSTSVLQHTAPKTININLPMPSKAYSPNEQQPQTPTKRFNISEAKILKIDNTQAIRFNSNSDTLNKNIPVNIQKISPILLGNLNIQTDFQQRKRVKLISSSNGKVFIRPIGEGSIGIQSQLQSHVQLQSQLQQQRPPQSQTPLHSAHSQKLNLPTINLTKVSVLDSKTFQPQPPSKQQQNQDFYACTTTSNSSSNNNFMTINKTNSPQIQVLPPKSTVLTTDKLDRNQGNIFIIGAIQTETEIQKKFEEPTMDKSNLSAELITEDTPVDIVSYENIIVEEQEVIEDENRIEPQTSKINNGQNLYKQYEESDLSTSAAAVVVQPANPISNSTSLSLSAEVDWELELDKSKDSVSDGNENSVKKIENNCIILKSNDNKIINNFGDYNDYIEEIVEESVSEEEQSNIIEEENNGYYHYHEEEIDVDDSTITTKLKN